ncbi:MAG: hypothetical protein RR315_07655, partial [Oscillospiraceae bacterium]
MEKGALLSPLDERDYRCNTVMEQGEKLPKNFEVWQPPVQNQGFVGNCVAQALSNIKECWLYKRHKTHRDFSVGFIYGWENRSYSGMYSRSALAQMVKIGDCMAADFEANLGIPQICELVEKRREELAAKAAENKS